jgi:hypothetical protein
MNIKRHTDEENNSTHGGNPDHGKSSCLFLSYRPNVSKSGSGVKTSVAGDGAAVSHHSACVVTGKEGVTEGAAEGEAVSAGTAGENPEGNHMSCTHQKTRISSVVTSISAITRIRYRIVFIHMSRLSAKGTHAVMKPECRFASDSFFAILSL